MSEHTGKPPLVRRAVAAALVAALAGTAGSAVAGPPGTETIASGLNNPRGLAFAPNGALYVTEAGRGPALPRPAFGIGLCAPSPSAPVPRCYGESGRILRIAPDGALEPLVAGLPSLALDARAPVPFPPFVRALDLRAEGGPVDVAFQGMVAFVTTSWGGDPAGRAAFGAANPLFGRMLRVLPNGRYSVSADVAAAENASSNPDGKAIDSNPYSLVALPGRQVVSDAGANVLWEVRDGKVRLFATFGDGAEAVPTGITEGPDGALYVGTLTPFPFPAGAARVLRVSSDGAEVTTYAAGFTAIVDVAFDAGGALYVLEVGTFPFGSGAPPFAANSGKLHRVCPGGVRSELVAGLDYPNSVAIGPDGAAYLTNRSTSAGDGEVLRVPVAPCP